jgi:hypothetical protein
MWINNQYALICGCYSNNMCNHMEDDISGVSGSTSCYQCQTWTLNATTIRNKQRQNQHTQNPSRRNVLDQCSSKFMPSAHFCIFIKDFFPHFKETISMPCRNLRLQNYSIKAWIIPLQQKNLTPFRVLRNTRTY